MELIQRLSLNLSQKFAEVRDIDSLRDFYVIPHLEVNLYRTKKDILITLFMGKQLKHEFKFKDLCAFKSKFAVTKKVVVL